MEDALMQVGVGGLLAVLLVREVFGFLRSRGEKVETPSFDGVGDKLHSVHLTLERLETLMARIVVVQETQSRILDRLERLAEAGIFRREL